MGNKSRTVGLQSKDCVQEDTVSQPHNDWLKWMENTQKEVMEGNSILPRDSIK